VRASSDSKPAGKANLHANQSSNGEKVNVKDGGAKGTVAKTAPKSAAKAGKGVEAATKAPPVKGGAKTAAPKTATPKTAAPKTDGKPGAKAPTSGAKAPNAGAKTATGAKATSGAKGKASADGKKPAAPPAPPRKIQVVQLTTLKPGARGTKASVARRVEADEADPMQQVATKKRRSAELTKQQLEHFRELLLQRRSRLSNDLSLMQDEALKVTAQDNSSDSVADTGTDNYEQDFTLGLIESEEALAREVDQALLRIEQNTFGVCESCQTPVPLARLEILPFARYCVECQQKREGQA
jgi:RNA polymerase-binding protein DksA